MIKAKRFFAVSKSRFNFPAQIVIIDNRFHTQIQIRGKGQKVAIGFVRFGTGSDDDEMHRLGTHLGAHNLMGNFKGLVEGFDIERFIVPVLDVCTFAIDGLFASFALGLFGGFIIERGIFGDVLLWLTA